MHVRLLGRQWPIYERFVLGRSHDTLRQQLAGSLPAEHLAMFEQVCRESSASPVKTIKKAAHKAGISLELSNDEWARVGELMQQILHTPEKTYNAMFSPHMWWRPGLFGDYNACFHYDRSRGHLWEELQSAGFLFLTLWEGDKPASRTIIGPPQQDSYLARHEGAVLFNTYDRRLSNYTDEEGDTGYIHTGFVAQMLVNAAGKGRAVRGHAKSSVYRPDHFYLNSSVLWSVSTGKQSPGQVLCFDREQSSPLYADDTSIRSLCGLCGVPDKGGICDGCGAFESATGVWVTETEYETADCVWHRPRPYHEDDAQLCVSHTGERVLVTSWMTYEGTRYTHEAFQPIAEQVGQPIEGTDIRVVDNGVYYRDGGVHRFPNTVIYDNGSVHMWGFYPRGSWEEVMPRVFVESRNETTHRLLCNFIKAHSHLDWSFSPTSASVWVWVRDEIAPTLTAVDGYAGKGGWIVERDGLSFVCAGNYVEYDAVLLLSDRGYLDSEKIPRYPVMVCGTGYAYCDSGYSRAEPLYLDENFVQTGLSSGGRLYGINEFFTLDRWNRVRYNQDAN